MRIEECQIFHSKLLPLTLLCGLLLIFTSCGRSLDSYLEKGEEYLQSRRFQEAEMQFREAINIDNNSSAAHWGLARSFEKQGKFLATVQELKKAAELDSKNLEIKSKLGNYYLLFNPPQIHEAEKVLADIFKQDANYIEGHILKASILSTQNKPEKEIVEVLNHAISLDQKRTESYVALSRFYMKNKKLDKAEEVIKKGISANEKRALGYMEYGRFLAFADRKDEAETQFQKAIEVEPKNVEARESLAAYYFSQRQMEKAEKVYKEIVELQENSPESLMQLANFYNLSSREDDAIKVYEQILNERTDYARARYKLAEIYLGRKEFDKVNAEVEKLLSVNDTDAEALMLRARVRLQNGESEEAVKDLTEVLKKQPTLQSALFYIAQAHLSLGQIEQARAFISDLEKHHPNYRRSGLLKIQLNFVADNPRMALQEADALIRKIEKSYAGNAFDRQELEELRVRGITAKGLAFLQLGNLAEAEKNLQQVAKLSPNSAGAKMNLARIYLAKRDLNGALELYEKALEIDSKSFDALSGAVLVLTRQKEFDKARAKIDKAIQENGDDKKNLPAFHYLKSDVFVAERNLDSAEAELKKAIEIDEEYLPAYSAYASLLISKNQTDAALEQYKKVVEKKPSASIYTLIGMLEDSRQKFDEAEKHYRKALKLSPGTPIAANNLAWLMADQNRGNLDEALRLAEDTAKKHQKAGFYDTLGWVNYKRGFYSQAVESFKKAIALDTEESKKSGKKPNANYRLRLGMALASSGDKPSARREIAVALQNGGNALDSKQVKDAKNLLGES